ncbi:MAG: hypothetical protein ABI873_19480 [Marmoricola sp.]
MTLEHYDLRDPQLLMDDLARGTSLHDGDVWLALVLDPATRQRLREIRRLPAPDHLDDEGRRAMSDLLYDTMHSLPIPPRGEHLRAVVVTVLVRPGFNVWGRLEKFWAMAWRYSNHNTDALDTDIIVVTEHGWASLRSYDGGEAPRLTGEPRLAG